MSDEYRALVDKVGAFTEAAFERRRDDMACRSGCDGCCQVWLSVSQVEGDAIRVGLAALSPELRADVVKRGEREREREAESAPSPRCAMLAPDGSCAIYGSRPLVCRTQGFALRYPAGFIPLAAVRVRTSTGEVTHCPLNFTRAAPLAGAVLDAERVDELLAVVNVRFAGAHDLETLTRHSLSDVAARANEPARPQT
jgi:uncharacterized protein